MKKVLSYLEIPLAIAFIFPSMFLSLYFFDESHKYLSVCLQLLAIFLSSLFLTWRTDRFKSYMSLFIPLIFSLIIWSAVSGILITALDKNFVHFWVTYIAGITCGIILYLLIMIFILVFFLHNKYEFFRRPQRSDLHTVHIMIWYFLFTFFAIFIAIYLRNKDVNYWMIFPFVTTITLALSSLVIEYEK